MTRTRELIANVVDLVFDVWFTITEAVVRTARFIRDEPWTLAGGGIIALGVTGVIISLAQARP